MFATNKSGKPLKKIFPNDIFSYHMTLGVIYSLQNLRDTSSRCAVTKRGFVASPPKERFFSSSPATNQKAESSFLPSSAREIAYIHKLTIMVRGH